jgi:hypothetical protein
MMNKIFLMITVMLCYSATVGAQVGIGTQTPDSSALLELKSDTKGILIPRMTAVNRLSILTPATGLLVYDTDSAAFFFYTATGSWTLIATGSGLGNHTATQNIKLNDNWLSNDGDAEGIRIDNAGNVGVGIAIPTEKLDVAGNIIIPGTSSYKYASPKTDYYAVPGTSFTNEGSTYSTAVGTYGLYIPDGIATAVGYVDAPVNLPDNAVVTKLEVFFIDKDGTYNTQPLQLWRNDYALNTVAGNGTMMASTIGSTGTNSLIQSSSTTTISSPTINNGTYAYFLRWGTMQANSNLILCKVVITYTVSAAG